MFKTLKNLFKRKEKNKEDFAFCGITLYVDNDGQTYVDIRMVDESEETIEHLASILCMFNPSSFFQVSSIVKNQLESEGKDELYLTIIEKTAGMITFDQEDIDQEYEEKPCVNPSDVL
jgi:hypothetical protein